MFSLDTGLLGLPAVQIVLHFLYKLRRKVEHKGYRAKDFPISLRHFVAIGFPAEFAPILEQAGWIGWDPGKQCLWLTAAGKRAWSKEQVLLDFGGVECDAVLRVPIWWGPIRELWLGDDLIRRLRQDATLGIAVVNACQVGGWPLPVKSPFADRGGKRVQMLTDGLRTLNAEQRGQRILFEALEDHLYFTWMVM